MYTDKIFPVTAPPLWRPMVSTAHIQLETRERTNHFSNTFDVLSL